MSYLQFTVAFGAQYTGNTETLSNHETKMEAVQAIEAYVAKTAATREEDYDDFSWVAKDGKTYEMRMVDLGERPEGMPAEVALVDRAHRESCRKAVMACGVNRYTYTEHDTDKDEWSVGANVDGPGRLVYDVYGTWIYSYTDYSGRMSKGISFEEAKANAECLFG